VELLVVIGIIALLMSILIPALSSARRQARMLKCKAALREIGNAFAMYAAENQQYWPVAVHEVGNVKFPAKVEMRWPDLIVKYVAAAKDIAKFDDINKIRQNSVIWGCPEWAKALENDDTSLADKVRVGYGMNPYPKYFEDGDVKNLANITASATPRGRYLRVNEWTHQTDRGLIADSVAHIIQTPANITSTSQWQQYDPVAFSATAFYVDGSRHAPPNLSKARSYDGQYMNMLFCDGHVASVSVREAWNAIHNPGYDKAGP
jgi:prepilin-type processing-associated H-X9-DG protein